MNIGDMQVWWIPQVPGEPFTVDVSTVEDGIRIMDILADYDNFQFEQNIKPDYSNVGGIRVWSDDADGEGNAGWNDWYDEETGEDDPVRFVQNAGVQP